MRIGSRSLPNKASDVDDAATTNVISIIQASELWKLGFSVSDDDLEREPERLLYVYNDDPPTDIPTPGGIPVREAIFIAEEKAVRDKLPKLTAKQRQVIEMVLDDAPNRIIAAAMGIGPSAARRLKKRATYALQQLFHQS